MTRAVADAARLAEARIRLHRKLLAGGEPLPPRLSAALLYVPRHAFVPVLYRRAGGQLVPCRPSDGDGLGWLDAVYSDEPLVTEVDEETGTPSGAVARPGLLAGVLDALDVRRGHRVLEVGTGTGYATALLCWLAGQTGVTSTDPVPARVPGARERLASVGYRPVVEAAEEVRGCARRAPYDRLFTVGSVPRIPESWLGQCVAGALMVVPVHGTFAWLQVLDERSAAGRLLPLPCATAALRTAAGSRVPPEFRGWPGTARRTTVPGTVLDDHAFSFFARLRLPRGVVRDDRGGPGVRLYDSRGGCQARVRDRMVTVVGQRDLWAVVEDAYDEWLALRRPRREWFEIRVTDRRQWISFRSPSGDKHTWELG